MTSATPAGRRGSAASPAEKPARERIFDVAKDLFYRQGIRAVGVETIVAEAGATKMSLYRTFPSKDHLVVAYQKERDALYWEWWDKTVAAHEGDPRAQIRALCDGVAAKVRRAGHRGCPFTNAAIEFPEADHPCRAVAAANKQEQRRRLQALAEAAGASDPRTLGDQLFLLIEGAYVSDQLLDTSRAVAGLADAADALVAAQLPTR
jgi:AcrR family transcriptional regulator